MIREFARSLPGRTHYEVLGLPVGADAAAVREAFFECSKRFHPGRHLGKEPGPCRELLHEIYKRVVLAHEVLSDPGLRREYDRRIGSAPEPPARVEGPSLRPRSAGRFPASALERLEIQIRSSRRKARERFEEALAQRDRGDWVRALSLVRLAMAFDPRETEFHHTLAELLPRATAEQAAHLRARAEERLLRGAKEDALALLEEAFELEPTDARVAFRVAELLREVRGDLVRALEFAQRAASLDEDDAGVRKAVGRLCKEAGLRACARKAFQRAWEIDPLDPEIKAELVALQEPGEPGSEA